MLFRLDKSAYANDEVIKLNLEIINDSSVDVLGATITVSQTASSCCYVACTDHLTPLNLVKKSFKAVR